MKLHQAIDTASITNESQFMLSFREPAHRLIKQKVSTRDGMNISEIKALDALTESFYKPKELKI
jgi:hypothetical protein